MSERISREELVKIYNIEITFFDELVDCGLLSVETDNDICYLNYDDLQILERYTTLYYDLEINLAGVDVIHHLLKKMDDLDQKNRELIIKLSSLDEK